jgi:phospholipase/carboxylesterase
MEAPMLYELRRPKLIEPKKKYPALFVMHGIGSNELNMLPLVENLKESFYIFSIRGHLPKTPGYAYFTIQGYGKPHRDTFDYGMDQLSKFIQYASNTYPLDLNEIYLLGFSQGAISAMTLGITLGDKIKGVVALSGYIPLFVKEEYPVQPGSQLNVFVSHGEFDQILPYEWGKENVEYFKGLGVPVTFKSYPDGHTVSIEMMKDFQAWLLNHVKNL